MVRRQSGWSGRRALTHDTIIAILMDMWGLEVKRDLMLNSDRFDTCPKVKSAIRDYVKQLRHKSDPIDESDMAWPDPWGEGEREDARAIG